MSRWPALLLVLTLTATAPALHAAPPATQWALPDQYDRLYSVDSKLRILLVAHSMAASRVLDGALADAPKGFLESRQAVFLADVSGMPSLITRYIAVPRMRDLNYRILLDREGEVTRHFPCAEDAVLWVDMHDGRPGTRREFRDAAALRQALERAQ